MNTPSDTMLLGTANSDGTFTGVTTGKSQAIPPQQHQAACIAVMGNGTVSTGVVTIEEALWLDKQMPYSGTWSVITTVTASTITGGAQTVIHLSPTALTNIRVRVSTDITGGGGVSAILRLI